MNGWYFDKDTNEFVNSYNKMRSKYHPEIGYPDEYWMNSVERVTHKFANKTKKGIDGIGLVIGINYHWPSLQLKIENISTTPGNGTTKYTYPRPLKFGYESFDPMI